MASISRDPAGRVRIQFIGQGGKRQTIRLGQASDRQAELVCGHVEQLQLSRSLGSPLDPATAKWLQAIGDDLADKLVRVGLVAPRAKVRLGDFLHGWLARRTDIKPLTRRNNELSMRRLIEHFGAERELVSITPAEADGWAAWMAGRYADGTLGRCVRHARQFFKAAIRAKLIAENPFTDVRAPASVNRTRDCFVSQATIEKVIAACPDAEWRLVFALSRFGGLRCPSEHVNLAWDDVRWDLGRLLVHSPKTEHHQDGADRWLPIFPELRPFLDEAWTLAERGTVWVINRLCRLETREQRAKVNASNLNLSTQARRIIDRAGVKPWEKLFHQLRASRQTELTNQYPEHVVCAWMGNSPAVARKHYLQVLDEHFERAAREGAGPGGAESGARAAQNPTPNRTAPDRTTFIRSPQAPEDMDFMRPGSGRFGVVQLAGEAAGCPDQESNPERLVRSET